jgi:hypothetical protein
MMIAETSKMVPSLHRLEGHPAYKDKLLFICNDGNSSDLVSLNSMLPTLIFINTSKLLYFTMKLLYEPHDGTNLSYRQCNAVNPPVPGYYHQN